MAKKSNMPKKTIINDSLIELMGTDEARITDCVKKVWAYVKKHDLQNPANMREILTGNDELLFDIFGKKKITMFEMTKILNDRCLE